MVSLSFGRFNRTWGDRILASGNMQSKQLRLGDGDHFMMGNKDPMGNRYRDFGGGGVQPHARCRAALRGGLECCDGGARAPHGAAAPQSSGCHSSGLAALRPRTPGWPVRLQTSPRTQEECTAKGPDCSALLVERTRYARGCLATLQGCIRCAPRLWHSTAAANRPSPLVAERRTGGAGARTLPLGDHRVS